MHGCMEEKFIFLFPSINLSSMLSSSVLYFSDCIYHTFLLSLHIFSSTYQPVTLSSHRFYPSITQTAVLTL